MRTNHAREVTPDPTAAAVPGVDPGAAAGRGAGQGASPAASPSLGIRLHHVPANPTARASPSPVLDPSQKAGADQNLALWIETGFKAGEV